MNELLHNVRLLDAANETIAALRATITQQAQELERLEGVCLDRLVSGQKLADEYLLRQQQIAASQARCREMEQQRDDARSGKNAAVIELYRKLDAKDERLAQLQATLAAREARIRELEDWQNIVLGSGTDQETVIRMAANEYTKTAVQCWKEHTKKIEAERDAAAQEAGRLKSLELMMIGGSYLIHAVIARIG